MQISKSININQVLKDTCSMSIFLSLLLTIILWVLYTFNVDFLSYLFLFFGPYSILLIMSFYSRCYVDHDLLKEE